MHKLVRNLVAAAAAITILAGCAPFATYPPVEGARGIDNPAWEPVPSILASSIAYVHNRFGGDREYAFNLPAGTPALVYDKVVEKLEGAAAPMTSEDQWAYHVEQVRSRGLRAEVDIIYPRPAGPHAMIEVHLRKDVIGSWRVESTKLWNIPVEEVPTPNYVPEPETTG